MLSLQNIHKSFGGTKAIQGSTFAVPEGHITALIGPNGAGKTTLFDIICDFVPADHGDIEFCGQNITRLPTYGRMNLGISRTFQQVRLFKYLTIYDHLRLTDDHEDTKLLFQLFVKQKKDRKSYEDYIRGFGIDRPLETVVSELSYGQRKLLDLAMAVRKSHRLLMLDEPVAGVNAVVQERVERMLLSLKAKGETMLIIDHDMEFIRKLADQVIFLDAGVVLAEGRPEEVLSEPKVIEAYLGD